MPVDIWDEFKQRFNIPYIGEFYASTEGNANLINTQNKTGAIGYIPYIAKFFYPVRIVEFDYDNECPIRDSTGHCIDIKTGETGELINLVSQHDPLRSFDGYTNNKSNQDKLLTDVFKQGDCYFRTGDLVSKDKYGFIYFVDRIGDTYRWKGENVSTGEVTAVLSKYQSFDEVNVYGVTVQHNDGRAGMAAITLNTQHKSSSLSSTSTSSSDSMSSDDSSSSNGSRVAPTQDTLTHEQVEEAVNMNHLYDYINDQLTSYQQPLFIRFLSSMPTTTTFKHTKVQFVKQGFDPDNIQDPIFFLQRQNKKYVPLNEQLYNDIQSGKCRL